MKKTTKLNNTDSKVTNRAKIKYFSPISNNSYTFSYYLHNFKIVLHSHHFALFSIIFHCLIIIPLFFEFFIFDNLNKYKIEQFLSIEFVNEPRSQHKNSSNTQYLNKNRSKGQQISHANTKASQKEIQEFMQEYEDHLSSHVGFILEQNIDDYNIEGDFNIQFSIDTNGNIVSIDYAKKSEDELSNVYLMRILKQIQKFKPIPQKYTNDPVSHFQLPINIEQD